MTQHVDEQSLEFFHALHEAFSKTLANYRGADELLPAVLSQVFTSYEGSVDMQAEGQPELACHKGCATCCTVRVVASAPEVLLVARYIRSVAPQLEQAGIDLPRRLAEADATTRGQDEEQRVETRCRCPFIHQGACIIYPVRPLACRGHASFDKQACADAAAGLIDEIPFSSPHKTVRGIVQNALQSALRDAGYPWAVYELNHALSIALADDGCEDAWLKGEDRLAPAIVTDISLEEMAQGFDMVLGRTSRFS